MTRSAAVVGRNFAKPATGVAPPRATAAGRGPAMLILFGLAACSSGHARAARPRAPVTLRLAALDGGEIDLSAYRGRVVVVHLFTTWSMASQIDVEELITAHRDHADRVTVVGVGLDPDGYVLLAPWRDANHIPYLITVASPAVRVGDSPLGPIAEVPSTVILGRDGAVLRRISGPIGPGRLEPLLAAALR